MTIDVCKTDKPRTTSLWFDQALLADGWAQGVRLVIENGEISALESAAPRREGDEVHAVGFAGLSNLHSHAFQRGMAGLTEVRGHDSDSFWTWRETMYRFIERLRPDEVEAIAAMSYVEMLESGFTRVGEFHYLHHDADGKPYANLGEMAEAIAAAAEKSAIALTLLPVFYAHAGFGRAKPEAEQRRFINSLDGYARLLSASRAATSTLPDAVVGAAPHSLRAATLDEIRAITTLCDGPIHIHIAEQTREVDDCVAWSGARPMDLLFDTVAVDSRWCLVHATHMTPGETQRLAASGAVAGLCPITEANLGDGIFPGTEYMTRGGVIGIGSDSNVLIDAAQELRMLEYSQRLMSRRRNVLSDGPGASCGGSLYRRALIGGAQATGAAGPGLRVGVAADIVSLKTDDETLVRPLRDQWFDAWIFAARDGLIADVWRRGRKVVVDGEHVARAPIRRRYQHVLSRILGSEST
ncbi:MAG: formimidoylglutamate deiminase [Rhodospirillaceae bacterium]|nr:formimidoylglutamate deiminase [Rhodospirillaceae bacterium]